MTLVTVQRWSAVVFLLAYVFQAHFVDASSPAWLHVAVLSIVVLAALLHLAPSLFLVVTDYAASRRAQLSTAVLSIGGALLGALLTMTGVATSTAAAPTPGHVPGSSCARCHADPEADHAGFSLSPHTESGVGCETCHDVLAGARPDLARAQATKGGPCIVCHDEADGGWREGKPAAAQGGPAASSAVAGPSGADVESPPVPAMPPRLCAEQVSEVARGLEGATPVTIEVQSGDASRLAEGKAEVELRAAMKGRELTIRARWADSTRDVADRLAVMIAPPGGLASFAKSGCAITCHSTYPVVHRAPEGTLYEWDVTEGGVTARTLTSRGYRPEIGIQVSGSMTYEGGARVAVMSIVLPERLPDLTSAPMSVAVFDREAKAHATRTKPIVLDLSCR